MMEHFHQWLFSLPFWAQMGVVAFAVIGLWFGADKVIWGSKRIARKFGISELIIGLTIVSIGSSLPEIFVNISAGLQGVDDVGVGNIIGSCFVQISFILGLCVLIGGTIHNDPKEFSRDAVMVLGSIIVLFLLGLDGEIATGEALLMVLIYMFYLYYLLVVHRKNWKTKKSASHILLNLLAVFVGAGIVWFSADSLVSLGVHAGEKLGIQPGVIGLLSGVGTSIPELIISLVALIKRSEGISLGNLLGSNITDPLFSLGIGAILAQGYKVSSFLLFTAIPLWFTASLLAMSMLYFWGKLTRIGGAILVSFYLITFYLFLL